jgi:hypothetical protein
VKGGKVVGCTGKGRGKGGVEDCFIPNNLDSPRNHQREALIIF